MRYITVPAEDLQPGDEVANIGFVRSISMGRFNSRVVIQRGSRVETYGYPNKEPVVIAERETGLSGRNS